MEYRYTKQKLSNGNTLYYKITEDGTHYQKTTSDEVVTAAVGSLIIAS